MRPLKTQFEGRGEVKGYHFRLMRMTNRAFLYEVSSGSRKHYEAFKRIINKRYARVSYPTSKGFGIWAWTYMLLDEALVKFNDLNSND